MKLTISILILLTNVCLSVAQTGKIYNADTKEPVAGATIKLKQTDKIITSDINGFFTLPSTGTTELSISSIGFTDTIIKISSSSKLNIALQPSARELDALIITASRTVQRRGDTPISVTRISPKQINETKSRDLTELLNKVPGVVMTNLNNEQHSFWFALSLLINTLRSGSGFSATALTGAWLLLVLIIPTAISSVIDMVHPMPSRLDLITATRNTSDSIAKNKNILNRFFEAHPEFKPANADPADRNRATLRNRIELELATEKLKAVYRQVAEKREATVRKYRFLSPAIFIQQEFNKIAGTDDERYKDFERRVLSFQQQFRNYFEPLVYRQEKFTTAYLDAVPSFSIKCRNSPSD